MLIVLSVYFLVVWLVFIKLQLLPWNRTWKGGVYGIAVTIGLVVLGALQYYTPTSIMAVVQGDNQKIYSVVGGQVESVKVSGTQLVSKGELLYALDARPFQYRVNQSAAALELAQIHLRDATTLVQKNAVARATLDLFKAERDQAQALYDSAMYDLENTRVTAPADGVVSLIVLYEGEVLTARTPAMNFFRITDVRIAASVKQNGLEKLVPGLPVTVVFPAAPGETYEAEVVDIPPVSLQGQFTTQTVANPLEALMASTGLYPVRISFPADAPEHLRRPGIEANVTVFTDEGNPINMLAGILQWVSSWMNYLF